ncbi:hypothetical protein [Leclercia adecarboxylata]|uniref:hypothetical protein n=1 Tax=Leclercia adecarboxylata TaxID=83655 RepID=UPI00057AE28C|nr:hypothetical protein [Leclercia adecarboxylata]
MSKKIQVEEVNLNAKCWVVRPGSGYKFTKQFIDGGFIAIGHLDKIVLGHENRELSFEDRRELYLAYPEISKLTTNVKAQIESFTIDMNVGDVVFTITGKLIIPGVIKSGLIYDPKPIRIYKDIRDLYSVRRAVEWGYPIDRSEVPLKFSKSLLAQQTVFSLGDNSKEVYHWLSSFFITKDGYYSSLRIEQKQDINHHALKSLSEVIDRIQVVSLLYENEDGELDLTLEYVKKQMEEMADAGKLTLTAQQMLMSPGDFWLGLKTPSKKAGIIFILFMAMIVNDDLNMAFASGNYQAEENIARKLVEKHKEVITKDINMEKMRSQLQLESRKQNDKFVEANPNDFTVDDRSKDLPPEISSN